MNTFQYTITKFDEENKTITVVFEDGNWAEIRLTNPLPKTKEDLEKVIRQFTAPVEVIQAQTAPDADLSYINPLIGVAAEAQRMSLADNIKPVEFTQQELLEQQLQQQEVELIEQQLFEAKVRAILEKVQQESNPTV